jgi:hypothetical protein
VLFPEIQRRRIGYQYEGNSVMILDGCAFHESDWFLDEALIRNAKLHMLPPHSSDEAQGLDLSLFGIAKQTFVKVRPDSQKSAHSN